MLGRASRMKTENRQTVVDPNDASTSTREIEMIRMNAYRYLIAFTVAAGCLLASPSHGDDKAATESVSVFGEKKLAVPDAWKRTKPQSSIVEHEFIVKEAEDDDAPSARVTLMAAGGDVKANIDRWKGQFTGGDAAAQKTEKKEFGDWTVHVVDLSGNFKESVGGGPFFGGRVVERTDYAMLGAILVHPNGRKYFVKMTGPADLVKANRDGMLQMFDGLKD